ncbi:hypothetical protein BFW01_g1205 [Lasiodiplodia theobromae]|uniref:Uncharacterized protein n=1 Tax=Lasiodiplodia theobromae TaxID=45133 RepID=A0A8H7IRY1_9PEZI|nr:hypothetical protein BFW01_g1205 [Lasiodiplodia theobromae]
MTAGLQPNHQFFVSSGSLCFGELHNIWHGASAPVQGFPSVRPQTTGTVVSHELQFNTTAEIGTWHVFSLIDTTTRAAAAWFACHSDVDPEQEVVKILRVSGSPYEANCGSTMNDDSTAAEGVLVVNRYDWGYYDRRASDEFEEDDEDVLNLEVAVSVGLVDRAQAKEVVSKWKTKVAGRRKSSASAAWLHIPDAEYAFGRFGFNEERTAARSFLLFTQSTVFTQTAFQGRLNPLREGEAA